MVEDARDRFAEDVFTHRVTKDGTVGATLSPSFGNADLALIRDANGNGVVDAGEVLASSALGGNQLDRVSKAVSAGTYFVRTWSPTQSRNAGSCSGR